jgi:signal transduction histidine kinase/DNA-binding NarL/FixJ family response regulator
MDLHRYYTGVLLSVSQSERDPQFRKELRDILHKGLRTTGGLGLVAVALFAAGQMTSSGTQVRLLPQQLATDSVVLADKILIAFLCISLILAARLRCSLQVGRYVAGFAVVVAAGASLFGDVLRGELAVGYVTLQYMLIVGAVPFRPRQTLGLGLALTALTCGVAAFIRPWLLGRPSILGTSNLLRLGVVTLLLTGISALLYESRRRQHEARQEAEELYQEVSRLEEAKSRFFANLSHELKSPLTLILGPIEDALSGRYGDLPEGFRHRLHGMKDQARRLRALVRQLLQLSELEEEKMSLDARPMSLKPFLERMASLFRSMADRQGADVRVETAEGRSGDGPVACVDPDALRQMVSNLLSNALSHTPEGGTVRLRASGHEESSGRVSISVRDTGPGLTDTAKEGLFKRYEGGESPSERSTLSTGIGLALVKELANRHGGAVQVESEKDFGTEITVELPARPSELQDEDLAQEDFSQEDLSQEDLSRREESGSEDGTVDPKTVDPEVRHVLGAAGGPLDAENTQRPETGVNETGASGGDNASNEKASNEEASDGGSSDERSFNEESSEEKSSEEKPLVLVVDDEAPVRNYVEELLAPQYAAVLVEDGKQALERAHQDSPDLIISDVAMPGLDGFQLCEALRQDEKLRTIPIILLTVQKDEESRMEGLRQGADAYLGKPFRPAELRQRAENLIDVRRYLRKRESRNRNQSSPSQKGWAEKSGENAPPDADGRQLVGGGESDFLSGVRAAVEDHLENSGFGVQWLAEEVGLSSRQLQRRLREEADLSAGAYIRAVRLQRAAELLSTGAVQTVKEAAEATGYRDPSHFSRLFKEAHGHSPSELKS